MTTRLLSQEEMVGQPAFNLARGFSTLTAAPPFSFERVLLNIFPLQADISALDGFLKASINIAPDFALFRPSMPFVMMIVAHYPKMSLEEKNFGWVSSNEITFAIPIEWYEPVEGRWVLKDYAQYSPYIFVDSDASQVEGRQVYGWPKMQGWLTRSVDTWLQDPRRPRTLLRMDSYAFSGGRDAISELLSIRQEAPFSLSVMPPEPNGPLNVAGSLSGMMNGWSGLLRSWSEWAATNAGQLADPAGIARTLRGMSGTLTSFTRALQANTINLKQFRDASAPGMACYQAITNASMSVTRFRRSGMLGDPALFRGDLTGGYEISLNSYPSLPIAGSLGLLGERQIVQGVERTILKPVLPFWQELDLIYGSAHNIAWRAGRVDGGRWRTADRAQTEPPEAPGYVLPEDTQEAGPIPYNTAGSSGYQVAEGPFQFPEAVVVVLPLLADPEKLKLLLTGLSSDRGGGGVDPVTGENRWAMFGQLSSDVGYFEPWGEYVYAVIKHLPEVSSSLRTLGVWSSSMVEFAVPVRWFRDGGAGRQLVSVGYVSPFMYSNSDIGSNTARELNGWPSFGASIESLPNTWLTREGPFSDRRPLLSLKTSMPEVSDSNARYRWLPLLELIGGNMIDYQDAEGWRQARKDWGVPVMNSARKMFRKRHRSDADFDDFQSLAANMFDRDAFRQFSLKQFRDADNAGDACYQALISTPLRIRRVWDMRELEERLHLNVYRRPTQKIVDTLGLKVKSRHQTDQGEIECLQPVRPFFFKAHLRVDDGEKICWRSGSRQWLPRAPEPSGFTPDRAAGGGFVRALRWQPPDGEHKPRSERLNAQNIATKREAWLRKHPGLDPDRVKALLSGDFDPQMAIDAMLSDEWEHWGLPRWYREWQIRKRIKHLRKRKAQAPDDRVEDEVIDSWLEALEGLRVAQLPPFTLRCDCVGLEGDDLFPFLERQPNEFDPEYWSPQYAPETTVDGEVRSE